MDQITLKIPNPKCRLYWCLIELIERRYSQSCWYFLPLLWISAPLTFSMNHLPPLPCTVCNREGGSGCMEGMELYTVHLTRFRTYKIALPPKQKPRRGRVLRQINTCRQVPSLKKSWHSGFGVVIDIWSMPSPYRIPPPPPFVARKSGMISHLHFKQLITWILAKGALLLHRIGIKPFAYLNQAPVPGITTHHPSYCTAFCLRNNE